MNIRHIRIEDAQALLELQIAIDAETKYMLYEAGERTTTVQDDEYLMAKMLT